LNAAKILVVDDAQQVRRVLRAALSAEGYTIFEAGTGEEALESIRKSAPDAILLDVNMPGMGGLETCREIRRTQDVPTLMLTVRNSERDKVLALDAGADDYVVKPFGMQELLARVRAALRRRSPPGEATAYSSKDFSVDFETRQVSVRGRDVHLTPKEFELLRHLVAQAGKPMTHRRLLQAVWGPDYGDEPEYLRVMVNQLRKKIESDPARPKLIVTEPWVGYRFRAPREPKAGDDPKD
jgi:two-component system, OmpR family, KDP operon response regulator KdpE